MSHRTHCGRWGLVPLALALAAVVVASPAAARGPVLYPSQCAPVAQPEIKASPRVQALCERGGEDGDHQGLSGQDAGIVAGGVGLLVLAMAGGMLVATHRRDAQAPRPAALS
jgi:hypothetical protein